MKSRMCRLERPKRLITPGSTRIRLGPYIRQHILDSQSSTVRKGA